MSGGEVQLKRYSYGDIINSTIVSFLLDSNEPTLEDMFKSRLQNQDQDLDKGDYVSRLSEKFLNNHLIKEIEIETGNENTYSIFQFLFGFELRRLFYDLGFIYIFCLVFPLISEYACFSGDFGFSGFRPPWSGFLYNPSRKTYYLILCL